VSTRRDFLRRGSLLVAGGLLLGDAALEAFERLTHVRKSFPSGDIGTMLDQHGRSWSVGRMIEDGGYECVVSTGGLDYMISRSGYTAYGFSAFGKS
jgi:hypothetical protein